MAPGVITGYPLSIMRPHLRWSLLGIVLAMATLFAAPVALAKPAKGKPASAAQAEKPRGKPAAHANKAKPGAKAKGKAPGKAKAVARGNGKAGKGKAVGKGKGVARGKGKAKGQGKQAKVKPVSHKKKAKPPRKSQRKTAANT
jgi:hypothetical protein